MGNENIKPDNYYMCVNIIGESMDGFLYCLSNKAYESYAKDRKKKNTLYDYWDYGLFMCIYFIIYFFYLFI